MKVHLDAVVHLLHEASYATLATQSTQLAGYPYATALPCVVDETHCPLFCVSALAEHTKNLLADPRVSLSVVTPQNANVQTAARVTLLGTAERFVPSPEGRARYLRYQPDAQQYLELDFMFFRLKPERLRYIGGIGQMGWLDAAAWDTLPVLAPRQEAALLEAAAPQAPRGIQLRGLDLFGVDYAENGVGARRRFAQMLSPASLPEALAEIFAAWP
jgi:heme iron utilization protein